MASMLGSIEREHAGPNYLGRAEPRVVDGEPDWVAHDGHGRIARQHDPSVQRRNPHHWSIGAQTVHHVVMVQVDRSKVGSSSGHPRRVPIFDPLQ